MVTRPLSKFKVHLDVDDESKNNSELQDRLYQQKSRGLVNDEIDLLVESYNALTEQNFTYLHEIEMANQELEGRVKERTEELYMKNLEIESIFNSLTQGIFSIDENFRSKGKHSVYLEEILDSNKLEAFNIKETLFDKATMSDEETSMAMSSLSSFYGADSIIWEINAHSLPEELFWTSPKGNKKILEAHWSPIVGREDTIESVVVTLRDVTQLRSLQEEAAEKTKQLQVLIELLEMEKTEFIKFFKAAQKEFNKVDELNKTEFQDQAEKKKVLFRSAHTIKGGARCAGLKTLSGAVHVWEQALDAYVGEDISKDPQISENESLVRNLFSEYETVARDSIEFFEDTAKVVVSIDTIQSLIDSNRTEPEALVIQLEDFLEKQRIENMNTFDNFFSDFENMINSTATATNKEIPVFEVQVEESLKRFEAQQDSFDTIHPAFIHLLSNCVDHGIEVPEKRLSSGKKPQGQINIEVSTDQECIKLRISDDGQGFNVGKIKSIAEGKGLLDKSKEYTDKDIAEFVFEASFSTSDQVSEVSGRGAGMDIVKSIVEDAEGRLFLEADSTYKGPLQPGFAKFSFVMRIPLEFFERYESKSAA